MSIPPYPLAWPDGLPRATTTTPGQFKATLTAAQKNVEDELRRFGNDTTKRVIDIVMTTNMAGLGPMPKDKGVAVWFNWDGAQRVFAVDRYATIAANLQAISLIISAHRTVMRHGGLNIVRQTFRGFTVLPAPEHFTTVLSILPGATDAQINEAYRREAKRANGDDQKLLTINLARDAAIADRKS